MVPAALGYRRHWLAKGRPSSSLHNGLRKHSYLAGASLPEMKGLLGCTCVCWLTALTIARSLITCAWLGL